MIILLLTPFLPIDLIKLVCLVLGIFLCHVLVRLDAPKENVLVVHFLGLQALLRAACHGDAQVQAVVLFAHLTRTDLGTCSGWWATLLNS